MRLALQIFAKYPHAGKVKTRLAQKVGDAAAVALHCELVERQLAQIHRLPPRIRCELWCTDTADAAWHLDLFRRYPRLRYRRQSEGSLGQRMEVALRRISAVADGIIQIGTDCPLLQAAHLRMLGTELEAGTDSAFIAAEDGGYVAGAYAGYRPGLFTAVEWGGPDVLAQSLALHLQQGLATVVYSSLWDVDRPDDYERYLELRHVGL